MRKKTFREFASAVHAVSDLFSYPLSFLFYVLHSLCLRSSSEITALPGTPEVSMNKHPSVNDTYIMYHPSMGKLNGICFILFSWVSPSKEWAPITHKVSSTVMHLYCLPALPKYTISAQNLVLGLASGGTQAKGISFPFNKVQITVAQ